MKISALLFEYFVLSSIRTNTTAFKWNVPTAGGREMRNGGTSRTSVVLLPLFLDALLFVAAWIQVEGEVGPLVTRREGDGLAQSEAYGVDDALASGLGGAHADGGGPAGGAHYVGRWGKIHGLSVLHDALPDDVLELRGDLQPGQVLMVITQGSVSIRRGSHSSF